MSADFLLCPCQRCGTAEAVTSHHDFGPVCGFCLGAAEALSEAALDAFYGPVILAPGASPIPLPPDLLEP